MYIPYVTNVKAVICSCCNDYRQYKGCWEIEHAELVTSNTLYRIVIWPESKSMILSFNRSVWQPCFFIALELQSNLIHIQGDAAIHRLDLFFIRFLRNQDIGLPHGTWKITLGAKLPRYRFYTLVTISGIMVSINLKQTSFRRLYTSEMSKSYVICTLLIN